MSGSVLFLDDESKILSAIRRMFTHSDLDILTTDDPAAALGMIGEKRVAVAVSDNMMPAVRGTDFLEQVRAVSPDTVRILMTGFADLSTAIDAINRCGVYKFIVKPWDNDTFFATILEAVERYRFVCSLSSSDEPTLLSLAQTIELKDRYTRGHCDRVAQHALRVSLSLGIDADTRVQIKYGSWLHDCGKIGVPEAILNKNGKLSPEEFEIMKNHPVWGAEVVRQAHLSETVINIVLHHHERWDGTGYPSGLMGTSIPQEARIVAIADVFDAITSDRSYRARSSFQQAKELIETLGGTHLDGELTEMFLRDLDVSGIEGGG